MKPLRLMLSGLNSFREEQEIDFSRLCDSNVFGIFGPTGSGKSTIIDAITLALYGKVERAPSRIQGIVNKGEDSANVCFDFSLGGSGQQRTYRVERKYVSKEDAITCRMARLSQLTDIGAVVLADKVSHVDSKVEEILGLNVDDFTRAVVLPQGKFAEFLSLKGADRREMLERIFNLGDYGERLTGLALGQYKEVESDVKAIEAEQAGLGDASEEMVKFAFLEVQQTISEVATTHRSLTSRLEEREQIRLVKELQQSLAQAQIELDLLEAEQSAMRELESKLLKMAAAESVEQYVRAHDECELACAAASDRLQRIERHAEKTKLHEQEQSLLYEQAVDKRQKEEPVLAAKVTELARAITMEERLREKQAVERRESDLLKQAQSMVGTLLSQAEELAMREQAAAQDIRELSNELGQCSVSPELRAGVERASKSQAQWQQAVAQISELYKELEQRNLSLKRANSTLKEAREKASLASADSAQAVAVCQALEGNPPVEVSAAMRDTAARYLVQFQQAKAANSEQERLAIRRESARQRLIALESEVSSEYKALEQLRLAAVDHRRQLEGAEEELTQLRQKELALELASQLVSGQRCPVCGAIEHPSPCTQSSVGGFKAQEQNVRSLRERLQGVLTEIAAREARHNGLEREQGDATKNLSEIDIELRKIAGEYQSGIAKFPMEWHALSLLELEQRVTEQTHQLEAAMEQRSIWVTERDLALNIERSRRDMLALANQAQALAEQNVATMTHDFSVLTEKKEQAEEKERHLRLLYDNDQLALNTEDLDALKKSIAAKDRRLSELTHAQKEVEAKRSELQSSLRELEQRLTIEQENVAIISTRLTGLELQIMELKHEIDTITQGHDTSEMQSQLEQRLTKLRENESTLKANLTEVRLQAQALEKESAACTVAYQAADISRGKALILLEQALQSAGFVSKDAVREVLLELPLRQEWQQSLTQYFERKAIASAEVAKLTNQLAGRTIEPRQWQEIEDLCLKLKNDYDSALHRRGEKEARLQDVEKRHQRFMALELDRRAQVKQRDLLYEIVTLLRGNALVEFMAQEHLHSVAGAATEWLRALTSNRYALEVDPDGGFVIRDDANGGIKRPVHTLSGGETFVASLALALALSAQIQLRGKYPLEFFFLDEGFGTLDPDLLETVMSCLERMQSHNMTIGIISHVPELRERIQRKIVVAPAERGGRGSRLKVI